MSSKNPSYLILNFSYIQIVCAMFYISYLVFDQLLWRVPLIKSALEGERAGKFKKGEKKLCKKKFHMTSRGSTLHLDYQLKRSIFVVFAISKAIKFITDFEALRGEGEGEKFSGIRVLGCLTSFSVNKTFDFTSFQIIYALKK